MFLEVEFEIGARVVCNIDGNLVKCNIHNIMENPVKNVIEYQVVYAEPNSPGVTKTIVTTSQIVGSKSYKDAK